MNHLAHLFLADPTPECRLGNLLADLIRSRETEGLPPAVRRGVMMHRRVDSYTDSHPVVHRSMARLNAHWGWYKGILIDVYYDRILALNWNRYSEKPLGEFLHQEAYPQLLEVLKLAPDDAAEVLEKMIRHDRLGQYCDAHCDGIRAALRRLTRVIAERIPRHCLNLEEALPELQELHDRLASDFAEFFPQLQQQIREWSLLHPIEEFELRAMPTPDPIPIGG